MKKIQLGMPLILLILCSVLLGITACSTFMPGPITAPLPSHLSLRSEQDRLTLQGRFAASYETVSHQIGQVYGHFAWMEQGDRVTLALKTPFGQTLATITAPRSAFLPIQKAKESAPNLEEQQVWIERPNRPIETASHVEPLMQKVLGFALPLRTLRYAFLQMMGGSAPHILEQEGWRIERMSQSSSSTIQRIVLEHRASPVVRVKLTIDPF